MAQKMISLAEIAKINGWKDFEGNDFPQDVTWNNLAYNLGWHQEVHEGGVDTLVQDNPNYDRNHEDKGREIPINFEAPKYARAEKVLSTIYSLMPQKEEVDGIIKTDFDSTTVKNYQQIIAQINNGYCQLNFANNALDKKQVVSNKEMSSITEPLWDILRKYKDSDNGAKISGIVSKEDRTLVEDTITDLQSRIYLGTPHKEYQARRESSRNVNWGIRQEQTKVPYKS